MKKTTPEQLRDKRCRLSLECRASTKAEIEAHGDEVGQWSLVGSIRKAISRSRQLFALEQRGVLQLKRRDDGGVEDVGPLD